MSTSTDTTTHLNLSEAPAVIDGPGWITLGPSLGVEVRVKPAAIVAFLHRTVIRQGKTEKVTASIQVRGKQPRDLLGWFPVPSTEGILWLRIDRSIFASNLAAKARMSGRSTALGGSVVAIRSGLSFHH